MQEGWGKRNWDWQFSAGVQHEIAPQVAVDVSYSRRSWSNFFVTHNRALTAADYDEVTLTAPAESDGCPAAAAIRSPSSPATTGAPLARPIRTTRRPTTSATRRTTGTAWTCRSTRA